MEKKEEKRERGIDKNEGGQSVNYTRR